MRVRFFTGEMPKTHRQAARFGLALAMAFVAVSLVFAWRHARSGRASGAAVESAAPGDCPASQAPFARGRLIDTNSASGCRVMAEWAARSGSPRALFWLERLAALEPENLSNRAALVRAALRFGEAALARRTLESFPGGGGSSPYYHEAAAAAAFSQGDMASAEAHLDRAERLDPSNRRHEINAQIVRLHSADTNRVRAARQALEMAQREPGHGSDVLRALASEALSAGDLDRARQSSLRLLGRPEADFEDRLRHLAILDGLAKREREPGRARGSATLSISDAKESGQSPADGCPPPDRGIAIGQGAAARGGRGAEDGGRRTGFDNYLAGLQREAMKNEGRAAQLLAWLAGHDHAEAGIAMAAGLPSGVRQSLPVRRAEIGCYGAARDWAHLADWLDASQWGPDDCLRHAFLALALRKQGKEDPARVAWDRAVRVGMPSAAPLLVQLAGEWQWEREAEALLWQTAREATGVDSGWALGLLARAFQLKGDTASLLRVFVLALEREPENLTAKNNVAAASLLLGTNLAAAHRLAEEVYQEAGSNPAFACTYAYSRHLLGRTAEGLCVLSGLPESAKRNPSTAAYFGTMLRANGQTDAAEEYAEIARSGWLLPEERALVGEENPKCEFRRPEGNPKSEEPKGARDGIARRSSSTDP